GAGGGTAPRTQGTIHIEPNGPTLHYIVRTLPEAGPQFGALFMGADISPALLGPEQLVATLLLALVPGLILAVLVRSLLPGRTLEGREEGLQEVNRRPELVDALLTLARADEGRAELHKEPVDLRAIVEEAGETGELLAEQAGVTMDVGTSAAPVVVSVDRSRI